MNLKVFSLILIATVFSGIIISEPAMAQNRGARFTFAPNYYRHEEPRLPRSSFIPRSQPVHTVAHGHVPKTPGYLGVDPSFLKTSSASLKPMTKSTSEVAIRSKQTNASFKKHFGNPNQLVATKPSQLTLKQKPATSVKAKVQPTRSVKRSVSAKRIKRHHVQPKVAKAKGYGNQYYTPGGHTPTSSTSSSRTSQQVHGKVIH